MMSISNALLLMSVLVQLTYLMADKWQVPETA
jgi:hypothetical protein